MYKVLWIDDEHEAAEYFFDLAEDKGIYLHGVSNAENGCKELRENYHFFDGLILDGVFLLSENDSSAEGQDAYSKVAKTIYALKENNIIIPWQVFSGNPTFCAKKNLTKGFKDDDNNFGNVFDKTNDNDREEMLNLLIKQMKENPLRIIKQKYSGVFNLFDSINSGQSISKIIALAELLEDSTEISNSVSNPFNTIRILLEELFSFLTEKNQMPKDLSFNEQSKFLCGQNIYYLPAPMLIHPALALVIRPLVETSQDGSHSKDELNYKVNDYIFANTFSWLISISTLNFFELCTFVSQNIKKVIAEGISYSRRKHTGKIVKIDNDLGTFSSNAMYTNVSIPPDYIKTHSLNRGSVLTIFIKPSPDKKSIYIDTVVSVE